MFLTNHFDIPAPIVADIYKQRWQVELFFKWVKQHLRIKSFYGTSINAVKSQIWVALSIYLLVVITRKKLEIQCSLYTFLQVLEVNLFEKNLFLIWLRKHLSKKRSHQIVTSWHL